MLLGTEEVMFLQEETITYKILSTPVDAEKLKVLLDEYGYDPGKTKYLYDGFKQGFFLTI